MDFLELLPLREGIFENPVRAEDDYHEKVDLERKMESQVYKAVLNMATNHTVVKLEEEEKLIGDPMEIKLL
mgnify:CR=1 FL=1